MQKLREGRWIFSLLKDDKMKERDDEMRARRGKSTEFFFSCSVMCVCVCVRDWD